MSANTSQSYPEYSTRNNESLDNSQYSQPQPIDISSLRILSQDQIRDIFDYYVNFGRSGVMTAQDSMDNFMFSKFAKECPGLLDGGITRSEVDVIFAKAKPKFERRLDYEHFLDALAAMAERKYPRYSAADGLRLLISNHLYPHWDFVQVEMQKTGETEVPLSGVFKKLYDVRNYTGVYAERFRSGDGRINGDTNHYASGDNVHNISEIVRPNLRGGTTMAPSNHLLRKSQTSASSPRAYSRSPSAQRTRPHSANPLSPSVRGHSIGREPNRAPSPNRGYNNNASYYSPVAKQYSSNTPVHTPAAGFANNMDVSLQALDPNALTTALERAKAGDASQLASLTATLAQALQSQVKLNQSGGPSQGGYDAVNKSRQMSQPRDEKSLHSSMNHSFDSKASVPISSLPVLSQDQIRGIFDFYCNYGRSGVQTPLESMDNFGFSKFVRECPGLLDGRRVTRAEADVIFAKAKPKFERRLEFVHFLDALAALSEKKYPDYGAADGLRLLIGHNLVPHWELVQVEMQKTGETEVPLSGVFKKLYDVRNYTGVYAERFRSGDGRINSGVDARPGKTFDGSTNAGTDEVIHDISTMMRPNLRAGSTMSPRRPSSSSPRGNNFRSTSPSRAGYGPSSVRSARSMSTSRAYF